MTKDFKTFRDLKAQSGFGWDEQKQVIIAEPDVWDAYIKKHPLAKKFRTKSLPFFDLLQELFGKDLSTGEWAQSTGINSLSHEVY